MEVGKDLIYRVPSGVGFPYHVDRRGRLALRHGAANQARADKHAWCRGCTKRYRNGRFPVQERWRDHHVAEDGRSTMVYRVSRIAVKEIVAIGVDSHDLPGVVDAFDKAAVGAWCHVGVVDGGVLAACRRSRCRVVAGSPDPATGCHHNLLNSLY